MSMFGFSLWCVFDECFFGIGAGLARSLSLLWAIVLFHSKKARQDQCWSPTKTATASKDEQC